MSTEGTSARTGRRPRISRLGPHRKALISAIFATAIAVSGAVAVGVHDTTNTPQPTVGRWMDLAATWPG